MTSTISTQCECVRECVSPVSACEREGGKQINMYIYICRDRETEKEKTDRVHGFVLMTFSSSLLCLSIFYFLILRVLTTVLVLFCRAEPLNANGVKVNGNPIPPLGSV